MRVRSLVAVCRGCRDDIVLEWHGRPGTEVGGRPCVALRTPDQLCNCLGPINTESRANTRNRTTDRGKTKSSQAFVFLAPASSSPSPDQTHNQLASGAITAQPVENRLARPIRSPPLSRRVCMARWSQVIQSLPSFFGKLRENLQLWAPSKSPAQVNGPQFIFMPTRKRCQWGISIRKTCQWRKSSSLQVTPPITKHAPP
jgi:hypothetical protein